RIGRRPGASGASSCAEPSPPLSPPRPPAASSPIARSRSATCSPASASRPTRPPSSSAWRPPRRLPPPPTHPDTGKRLQSKGAEPSSVLTVNGRVVLYRRRYFATGVGSFAPLDGWLDAAHSSISRGVAEMACRLNQASRCFAKAADNLARCAQVSLSRESLRQLAESEGRAVMAAERSGRIPLGWSAADCFTHDERGRPTTLRRVYLGSDGVMGPAVTQQRKDRRRAASRGHRRSGGR